MKVWAPVKDYLARHKVTERAKGVLQGIRTYSDDADDVLAATRKAAPALDKINKVTKGELAVANVLGMVGDVIGIFRNRGKPECRDGMTLLSLGSVPVFLSQNTPVPEALAGAAGVKALGDGVCEIVEHKPVRSFAQRVLGGDIPKSLNTLAQEGGGPNFLEKLEVAAEHAAPELLR